MHQRLKVCQDSKNKNIYIYIYIYAGVEVTRSDVRRVPRVEHRGHGSEKAYKAEREVKCNREL